MRRPKIYFEISTLTLLKPFKAACFANFVSPSDFSILPTGASFSKLPVITEPVKLFCFPFQMRVSKGFKIGQ